MIILHSSQTPQKKTVVPGGTLQARRHPLPTGWCQKRESGSQVPHTIPPSIIMSLPSQQSVRTTGRDWTSTPTDSYPSCCGGVRGCLVVIRTLSMPPTVLEEPTRGAVRTHPISPGQGCISIGLLGSQSPTPSYEQWRVLLRKSKRSHGRPEPLPQRVSQRQ